MNFTAMLMAMAWAAGPVSQTPILRWCNDCHEGHLWGLSAEGEWH